MSSATGSNRGGRSPKAAASGQNRTGGGSAASASSATGPRPRSHRVSRASAEAQEDLDQQLDNLDEDLTVAANFGIDPDDFTGDGGLETNAEGRPVIRDNRKVDPVSGRARKRSASDPAPGPDSATSGGPAPAAQTASDSPLNDLTPGSAEAAARALEDEVVAAAELISAREELTVRTEDLQRLSAEYANYRKRVDRDRSVAGDQARAEVLTALIPVLDDIDAARKADELTGPFQAVAEKLEAILAKFGLERYGAEGEAFDPTIHEALLHQTDPEIKTPTISLVLQPGYRMGERVLRAARVGVVDSGG